MQEQRRYQRIRFNALPRVRIGQFGLAGTGQLENLSIGGLMLRTDLPLKIGESCGCEFVVLGASLIDVSTVVVSKIGNLYGARFQAGPVSEWLIQEAMNDAIASGKASALSINDLRGRRVMRISGGLDGAMRNDFMHHLSRAGIDDLDLERVTDIDSAGRELCRTAVEDFGVVIVAAAPCVQSRIADLTRARLAS